MPACAALAASARPRCASRPPPSPGEAKGAALRCTIGPAFATQGELRAEFAARGLASVFASFENGAAKQGTRLGGFTARSLRRAGVPDADAEGLLAVLTEAFGWFFEVTDLRALGRTGRKVEDHQPNQGCAPPPAQENEATPPAEPPPPRSQPAELSAAAQASPNKGPFGWLRDAASAIQSTFSSSTKPPPQSEGEREKATVALARLHPAFAKQSSVFYLTGEPARGEARRRSASGWAARRTCGPGFATRGELRSELARRTAGSDLEGTDYFAILEKGLSKQGARNAGITARSLRRAGVAEAEVQPLLEEVVKLLGACFFCPAFVRAAGRATRKFDPSAPHEVAFSGMSVRHVLRKTR